jgi:hypothetical protein
MQVTQVTLKDFYLIDLLNRENAGSADILARETKFAKTELLGTC